MGIVCLKISKWIWSIRMHLGCNYLSIPRYLPLSHKSSIHDDVIKWRNFPRYWPFVRGIHRSPMNTPHKDQWCGALMFSLICSWINGWANGREAGDLRRHRAHYDVTVISMAHVGMRFLAYNSYIISSARWRIKSHWRQMDGLSGVYSRKVRYVYFTDIKPRM